MNAARALFRRWLGLPPARSAVRATAAYAPLADGVRLCTTLLQPERTDGSTAPTVLWRSERPTGARTPVGWLGRLLAEDGFAVVLQECRGRGRSEGRFAPFAHEAHDGRDAIAWIAAQPWFDGRLAVAGSGYSGYAAWAALGDAPLAVRALLVAFGARDPYAWLRPGGALALASALRLALETCESETPSARRLDLARALPFRPVREADRVALRQVSAFRSWVDHPERDAFWESLAAPVPERPPATLLMAGWDDPALAAPLAAHAALRAAAERSGAPAPQLALGAMAGWRDAGEGRGGGLGDCLRRALAFLDQSLRGADEPAAPVRILARGARRWRDEPAWPPPDAVERVLYLRSGALAAQPPAGEERPDEVRFDADDPVPSGGPRDDSAAARPDVLRFTGEPAGAALEISGPVRAELHASLPDGGGDLTARLLLLRADGRALALCEGIRRGTVAGAGSEGSGPIEIDLGGAAVELEAGDRLRLEIATSSFPRYDRNPEHGAGRVLVRHDASHPSRLLLWAAKDLAGAREA